MPAPDFTTVLAEWIADVELDSFFDVPAASTRSETAARAATRRLTDAAWAELATRFGEPVRTDPAAVEAVERLLDQIGA